MGITAVSQAQVLLNYCLHSTCQDMWDTFHDFNEDILELTQSNDPLSLNSTVEPVESYHTTKASATTEVETQLKTKMAEPIHYAIPHYLKLNTININNNVDSAGKDAQATSNTTPTLQVNIPTISHSLSTGGSHLSPTVVKMDSHLAEILKVL